MKSFSFSCEVVSLVSMAIQCCKTEEFTVDSNVVFFFFFFPIYFTIMYVKTDWEEKLQQLCKTKMDRKSIAVGVH